MNLTKPQQLIYDMVRFSGGAIAMICGSMLCNGEKDIYTLRQGVNEIYRMNEALRIRVSEIGGSVHQRVVDYAEHEIEILRFDNRQKFDAYAGDYAKIPLDLYGNLCEIKIVVLPGQYGLLAKLHHIVGDAWTLALLGTQFHDILEGKEVKAYSYIDYLESEKPYLQSKHYEKDKMFFVQQFKRCDEVTYLSEKQNDTFKAERKTHVIDSDKAKQIMDYAKQHDTSPFILFTAALSIYMNRVKMNAEKFYIGTAVLNRNGVKEKNTAGMFINTVPMLMELDNEKIFAQNLKEIQATVFSVLRHQKYNYGDVLATIRKEYGFQEKLYDVMISYQNAKVFGNNCETTWYHSGEQSESLQIHIDDRDNEGIFRIHYDYLIEKFTEHEIDRLHEHICNLLFDAIENDTKQIYELDILSVDEKNKLLYKFNDTAVDYPRDKCVHQLFEEQVKKTPDKIALIACDRTLTYRKLNEQANCIAHSLIEKGIGVGDIVALALSRKSYLIATILGILKSGAAYLPIAPDYPQDRIDYMLADSNAKLFINENNVAQMLQNCNIGKPLVAVSSKDLFCCIYTSGSTGQPKGVTLNHNNFVNYFLKHLYTDYVRTCETAFCISNVIFDMFINEVFSALLFGLRLVLASEDDISTSQKLAVLIKKYNIESIICTPTKFSMYMANTEFQSAIAKVKLLTFGGEILTDELCKQIAISSNATIINGYGPTETTIVSTYGKVDIDAE